MTFHCIWIDFYVWWEEVTRQTVRATPPDYVRTIGECEAVGRKN